MAALRGTRISCVFFVLMLAPALLPASPPLLNQYCVGCHNEKMKSGGLALTALDSTHVERDASEWEKVVVKLRAGDDAAFGWQPRPSRAVVNEFAASLETSLDRAAALKPNPGRPALHRLNRTEYGNSIRDLVDLDIDPAAYLPGR